MRLLVVLASVAGCMVGEPPSSVVLPPAIPSDAFDTLKAPADAHAELCAHDATDLTFPDQADRITNRFCQDVKPGGVVPQPHGLKDLLSILNLDFKDPAGGNGVGGNPAFAILGHSSALTARKVSSITPTAFVFTPLAPDGSLPADYMFLAFDPGEPFVEVASFSPSDMAVNFYLVLFDKDCTATGTCGPNDMLTPAQTTGWSNVRIYESTTFLNNTIADCRQCHIGTGHDGPTTTDPMILRMQEIEAPHTHWFSSQTIGGQALLRDFHAAHGAAEDYGPIPAALVDQSDPELMAQLIKKAGFGNQPNAFPSAEIEQEIMASAPMQPESNMPMGVSSSWHGIYRNAMFGQFIPVPYHDVKVTDADKCDQMTAEYQDFVTGKAASLDVDIRDVFLDDGLADMGFAAQPAMTGSELLVQQCQQCHNSNLDPTITRDKFLVDKLDQMSRDEKDLAIQRIQMATTTRLTMPPPLFRTVTPDERSRMIEALRQ